MLLPLSLPSWEIPLSQNPKASERSHKILRRGLLLPPLFRSLFPRTHQSAHVACTLLLCRFVQF